MTVTYKAQSTNGWIGATAVDFAAGSYPIVNSMNFGELSYTFPVPVQPAPAESAADFAVRLAAEITAAFAAILVNAQLVNPISITPSVAGPVQRFTLDKFTVITTTTDQELPITESTGASAPANPFSIAFDFDALTAATADHFALTVGSGILQNWGSSVNNFAGSPYAGRV